MKNLVRTIATLLFMAGASSAFAAPVSAPQFTPKISIALPTAQFDFSDLDIRDEFNRSVAAPALRQRFEAQLNRELNHLLLENLTPSRRAWLAILDSSRAAFGDWISAAVHQAAQVARAFLRGNPLFSSTIQRRSHAPLSASIVNHVNGESGSLSLLLRLISSTRLLR